MKKLVLVLLFLSGCTQRYTTETVWPGDPPDIVVEWPPGVTDVYTSTSVSGTTFSVAPLAP